MYKLIRAPFGLSGQKRGPKVIPKRKERYGITNKLRGYGAPISNELLSVCIAKRGSSFASPTISGLSKSEHELNLPLP